MNHTPTRERLPRRRAGVTHSVEVNGAAVFITTNQFSDGRPGEVFAKWGKEGSTAGGLMDAFSIVLSLALQYGVPAEVIVSKLKDLRFEPFGWTDDPEIPEVSSVMDWVARRIALDHLPFDTRKDLDVLTTDEEAALPADAYAPTPLVRPAQPPTPAASRSA
jgi:ribonucleoside-diphosphate reductase alpha chain